MPAIKPWIEQLVIDHELKDQVTLAIFKASLFLNHSNLLKGSDLRDAANEIIAAVDNVKIEYERAVPAIQADKAARAIAEAILVVNSFQAARVAKVANMVAGVNGQIFKNINFDVNWLENNSKETKLQDLPLWLNDQNPLNNQWETLKTKMLRSDKNWKFWLDFYQAKLDGAPISSLTGLQQKILFNKIINFPVKFWEKKVLIVNDRIADLLEETQQKERNSVSAVPLVEGDLKIEIETIRLNPTETNLSNSKADQFRTFLNSPEFRSNVEKNKVAISFACAGLIVQVEEYKKTVSGSNSLEPELKEHILGTLDNLTEAVNNIGNSLETGSDVISDEGLEEVASYFSRFCEVISCELENYIAPENIGKAVVPTGIILSCGGLGALLGGGIGFGVGGFIGKLITNNLKPKEIVDKIEENIDNPN